MSTTAPTKTEIAAAERLTALIAECRQTAKTHRAEADHLEDVADRWERITAGRS